MDKERITKLVKVAKMYYHLECSQQDIANELGTSRPSISRLLQEAKEEGIVQIEVVDPYQGVYELSEKIEQKFNLQKCIIVNVPNYDDTLVKQYLGKEGAKYLRETVQSGDIIGTTWGTTLYEVTRNLLPKNVTDVTVVQLNGGVSYSETNTYASDILSYLGNAFNTVPHFLPLPAVVDHVAVKEGIVADRHIKKVLELGIKANIAVFTVGGRHENSTLVKADYFTEEELEILAETEAVADICSRFYDINGAISNDNLNARTIGISLDDLKQKEHAILIAGGRNKVAGIIGALNGGYADVLITDQYTAESVLENTSI